MTSIPERHWQTGGDPRTLADYAALRDELNKLTHPARPDVNWSYAETLCLNLFEQNGIELQTAAWYTLARTHQAGLRGMNEGLAMLAALIALQWGSLWPQAVHARVNILSTLARHLQQHLRAQALDYAELSALYQAEQHLCATTDALQRLELKHQAGLDVLLQQLRQMAVHLENRSDTLDTTTAQQVAQLTAMPTLPEKAGDHTPQRVWVISPPPSPRMPLAIAPPRHPWRAFAAGMLTMLLAGSAMLWGAAHLTDNPEQRALMATVAPLPAPLSVATLEALRQHEGDDVNAWFAQAQAQLEVLSRLSPEWTLNYGSELVNQAKVLWPKRPETTALTEQWQQQLTATAAPIESLEGWKRGMTQLQVLADQLNELDEQKGKYLTVSELKSQVFAITQAFSQTIPAQELLRQLAEQPQRTPEPAALRAQTELHLKQLLARYAQLSPVRKGEDVTQ